METVATVAQDFCNMMLNGRFIEAAEAHWSRDVASVEPADLPGGIPARVEGKDRALKKLEKWFGASSVKDFKVEGPFVTEDAFAVGIEMTIMDRATGEGRPLREIGVYKVRNGKITEERYFY